MTRKEESKMEEVRLQKFMADCGIASRRKCEEYILEGKVKINGETVNKLGIKVNPQKDEIIFEGEKIKKEEKKVYILLNKPIDYVTTVHDQFERKNVLELIKGVKERLVPVGRLDMYTSGALILTNDGDFVYKVTHPKHEINKTYVVTLKGIFNSDSKKRLETGVQIEDYKTKPAKVKILKIDEEKNTSRVEITIHEGKNRQVRKMCETLGYKVLALHRTKIGVLSVNGLKIGEWRYLRKEEIERLK